MTAAQDRAGPAEHAELRATVSRIAAKFGGSYYAARAQAGRVVRRAVAGAGRGRVHRGQHPGRVRRGRRRDYRAGHRLRGDGGAGLPAAAAPGVQRDQRRGAGPLRHRRAAAPLAAGHRRRHRQGGVRHHRARRRVEHPPAGHHGPAGDEARSWVLTGHQVLHLRRGRGRGDPGRGPGGGAGAGRGGSLRRAGPVPAARRRPRPDRAAPAGRRDAARAAVHAALRRHQAGPGRAGRRRPGRPGPGLPRAQPGAHHRGRGLRRHRPVRAGQGGRATRAPGPCGTPRSAATRAWPTRWPGPRSRPSWPR